MARHKLSELTKDWPPERLAQVRAEAARELEEMRLDELRRARERSQVALAEALSTSQASISKLERRVDVYVSTLRRYIESLGGELDIIARFPGGDVRITQFSGIGKAAKAIRK